MSDIKIASRYAKSLIDLANERNELEKAHEDMQTILSAVSGSRDLDLLLKSPVVKKDVKQKIVDKVFAGKLSEMTSKFISIILKKGREDLIIEIADEFVSQYKTHLGIVTAYVKTAFKLDDSLRKKVLEAVKDAGGSKVDIIETVDEELIGGIIVRVGDRQIDASIQRQLNDLRRDFSHNPYIADF